MAQPVGGGFLQADVEGLHQAGEAELFEGVVELSHVVLVWVEVSQWAQVR